MSSKQSIIDVLLNKIVIVENGEFQTEGTLLNCKQSVKTRPHSPELLVLEKDGEKCIIRRWTVIKTHEKINPRVF